MDQVGQTEAAQLIHAACHLSLLTIGAADHELTDDAFGADVERFATGEAFGDPCQARRVSPEEDTESER